MPFLLRLLRHILMEACQLRRPIWHMILTSFGERKFTVRSATLAMFSRPSCIDISLLMTVTVTVLVYALDTWTHDGNGQIQLFVCLLSIYVSIYLFLLSLFLSFSISVWVCSLSLSHSLSLISTCCGDVGDVDDEKM